MNQFLVIMRSLLIWVNVNRTASCEKSLNKSVIMLEKLRGALHMKMTATCGIQKFHWKEKIKHLSKYWGGGRQHRTTPAGQILGGRDPCGVDAYAIRVNRNVRSATITPLVHLRKHGCPVGNSRRKCNTYLIFSSVKPIILQTLYFTFAERTFHPQSAKTILVSHFWRPMDLEK